MTPIDLTEIRRHRGTAAHTRGRAAEGLAADALVRDGWSILARNMRTEAGELDIVAEREGLVAFVEVKARPTLSAAAAALRPAQQARLVAAAEAALLRNPAWGRNGARFDVLLVDGARRVRRIANAITAEAA